MSDPLDPILPHNPQKLAVEIQRELKPFLMSFDTLEKNLRAKLTGVLNFFVVDRACSIAKRLFKTAKIK